MNADPASLDNLRDIAVPPPVPWWPPAPGWWMLFALLLIATMAVAIWRWIAWRANAYRRVALREHDAATTAVEIAEILKRTALAAYPRHNVASLSGQAWHHWLTKTGGRQVSDEVAKTLSEGVFGRIETESIDELRNFVREWIRQHEIRTEEGFQTEGRKGSEEV